MENLKSKLSKLVLVSDCHDIAKEVFKDENFGLQYFERNKDQVLDDLESRLFMNKQMNNLVFGLEEAVSAIGNFDAPTLITNLVDRDGIELILYTNTSYTVLLGLI